MSDDFDAVYERLHGILEKYESRLHVSDERPEIYALDLAPPARRSPRTWFGAVRRGKRYVSYYLMPIYEDPSMLDDVSAELRRRMQGKSCFNFTKVDEGLFSELAALTARGYERVKDLQPA